MPRLIMMMEDERLREAFAQCAKDQSGWLVDWAENLDELRVSLTQFEWDILMLGANDVDSIHQTDPEFIKAFASQISLVVLLPREKVGREHFYLGLDIAGVVPCDSMWAQDIKAIYGRLRLVTWIWRKHADLNQMKLSSARREGELVFLAQLSQQISGVLDEDILVSHVVHGVGERCPDGAVAFMSLESGGPAVVHEGLFSDSEVEGLEFGVEPTAVMRLRICDQYATSQELINFMEPQVHPSWDGVLEQQSPSFFRYKPPAGTFPGLEALWHRLGHSGCVYIVPVWGRVEVIGLFVVAEFNIVNDEPMWSMVGLQAMANQVGSAIEGVRQLSDSQQAYEALQSTQDKLVHAEKFAAVGHLAAQIAHEINNPSSFIISNIMVMQEYIDGLNAFTDALELNVAPSQLVKELRETHDVDFIQEDLKALLQQSGTGMQRIQKIVRDLRYFAHEAGPEMAWFDIEALIEASITLVRQEIKYSARVECDFAGVGQLYSDSNKLSQVVLNLLLNSNQALEDGDPETDVLHVGTLNYNEYIIIFVEDTGTGIAPEFIDKIFDPFFTTKVRGQGTGLGLSISRDILLSLGGDIRVFSELGRGTRFEILLPSGEKPPTL